MRIHATLALIFAAMFACTARAAEPAAASDRPNIVFVLADDLGYGDLGCYGQTKIATPELDRLASQGMRFTQFYAGSTVCAPSRCVLMSGRHAGRCLIRGNAEQALGPGDVTIARVLQRAGYATGLYGKWGLGDEGTTGTPMKQGFDAFYGYMNQHHAHNYYPSYLIDGEARVKLRNVVPDEYKNGAGVASVRVEHSHELIFEKALGFIERNKDRPFFLYLALTMPHANNEAKNLGMEAPDPGPYADREWPAPAKGFAGMMHRLDVDMGRLSAKLQALGLERKTLVIFSSDNGPHSEGGHTYSFFQSSGPLQGQKRSLTEGGIRVPFIVRWPGKIQPGVVSGQVAGFVDMMATLAELGRAPGDTLPEHDGLSIVPTLLGQPGQKQHECMYWSFYEGGGGQALRMGDWKLVQQPYHTRPRLYDLSADVAEARDLAEAKPEIVARMRELIAREYQPSEKWKFPTPKKGG